MSEFLLYVLQQLTDAYVDLRPWLSETGFSPSELIQSKVVINTDPGMSPLPQGRTADTRPAKPWGLEMLWCVGSVGHEGMVHHGWLCPPHRAVGPGAMFPVIQVPPGDCAELTTSSWS